MAKIIFKNQSDYFLRLQKLEQVFAKTVTIEKAINAGSKPVADQIRKNLEALKEEEYRYLDEGEVFHGISKGQKKDLADSFGLTPIDRDRRGFVHTKAGFEGYGSFPTAAYPKGLPNPMVARAVESGSSVREKMPFVLPAVQATRKESIEAMEKVIDEEIEKIFRRN